VVIISQSQRNIQNCVVAEFVAMFNRGYQPLALLEEVPPLIYRSTLAPQNASHMMNRVRGVSPRQIGKYPFHMIRMHYGSMRDKGR